MAIDNSTNELEATRTDLDSLDLCSFSVPGGFLWALCKYLTISTAVSILMLVPIGGVYAALSTLFGMDDSNVFLIGILLAVPFTFWFCSDYLIYRVGVGQNGIELGHELFGRLIEFEEVTFLSGEPRRDELGQFYPQLVLETGRRRHVIKMRQNEVTSCFERLRPLCVRAAAVSPQSEEFAAPHPDARIRGDARLIAHRLRSMTVAWLVSLFAIAYGGFLWYAFVVNANGAGFGLLLLPGGLTGLSYAVAQTKRYSELRVKWLMKSTALTEGFISSFKERTEAAWRCAHIDPVIIGLQFQAGTRWNPGLTDGQIELFENHFSVQIPDDYRLFLKHANGTDKERIDVRGSSGEPHETGPGVYAYPRDVETMDDLIACIAEDHSEVLHELASQGIDLPQDVRFIPIHSHRFLACTEDPARSMVCSIYGTDAIVYGANLKEYLEAEFLALR